MRRRAIREVAARTAVGISAALGITWAAFAFHLNLSSATSLQLLLVTTIALRWGLLEASIVSLLSVLCPTTLFLLFFTGLMERAPLRFSCSTFSDCLAGGAFLPGFLLIYRCPSHKEGAASD